MNVTQRKALEALEFETGYLDSQGEPGTRFAARGQLGARIGELTMSYLVSAGYAISANLSSSRKGYRITEAGKAALAKL